MSTLHLKPVDNTTVGGTTTHPSTRQKPNPSNGETPETIKKTETFNPTQRQQPHTSIPPAPPNPTESNNEEISEDSGNEDNPELNKPQHDTKKKVTGVGAGISSDVTGVGATLSQNVIPPKPVPRPVMIYCTSTDVCRTVDPDKDLGLKSRDKRDLDEAYESIVHHYQNSNLSVRQIDFQNSTAYVYNPETKAVEPKRITTTLAASFPHFSDIQALLQKRLGLSPGRCARYEEDPNTGEAKLVNGKGFSYSPPAETQDEDGKTTKTPAAVIEAPLCEEELADEVESKAQKFHDDNAQLLSGSEIPLTPEQEGEIWKRFTSAKNLFTELTEENQPDPVDPNVQMFKQQLGETSHLTLYTLVAADVVGKNDTEAQALKRAKAIKDNLESIFLKEKTKLKEPSTIKKVWNKVRFKETPPITLDHEEKTFIQDTAALTLRAHKDAQTRFARENGQDIGYKDGLPQAMIPELLNNIGENTYRIDKDTPQIKKIIGHLDETVQNRVVETVNQLLNKPDAPGSDIDAPPLPDEPPPPL